MKWVTVTLSRQVSSLAVHQQLTKWRVVGMQMVMAISFYKHTTCTTLMFVYETSYHVSRVPKVSFKTLLNCGARPQELVLH